MAIDFLRLKLRRRGQAPVLLSGGAALHLHGALDLFGDTIRHADVIGEAVDGAQAMAPPTVLPLDSVLGDACSVCPRARPGCACLQVDRYRVDGVESLSPILLRPGLPVAVARAVAGDEPPAFWHSFSLFRSSRAVGAPLAA